MSTVRARPDSITKSMLCTVVQLTTKLSPDFVRSMYWLNETQASVFYIVREWCLKHVWGHNPEPLFYFISGGAGCGKSHVIKCVYQEATKILRQLPRFRDEADMSLQCC
ncbi:hypothetical protein AAFF_G00432090 [Aldrovandia affinis]|uniref:Uncharacterized protein n=1 Tax=Aldrovandia affinis TaxID=143900 RepID=A0AAD7R571_9TELE|nr:hypothetical protein AAFF_G00432090 [Aldrovandia affinis]